MAADEMLCLCASLGPSFRRLGQDLRLERGLPQPVDLLIRLGVLKERRGMAVANCERRCGSIELGRLIGSPGVRPVTTDW